ncbi:MAG: hypothetical protein RJQ00_07130 [Vicingaceae bacterium]
MKNKVYGLLVTLSMTSFVACSQNNEGDNYNEGNIEALKANADMAAPHQYGGWYCPDNLNGFPAVDFEDWENVPVVNGRLATKKETQSGTALIYIDPKKYPNAKTLDITMPKLAKFYCVQSKREELIIVIQALKIQKDSIVGFRYINGGNGSARLSEVRFLTDNELASLPSKRFIRKTISINAEAFAIWEVLTKKENSKKLQTYFDAKNKINANWRASTNMNYYYANSGVATSLFADVVFGNYYIQNDYENSNYTEKFLLLVDNENQRTNLQMVSGPFGDDFEEQERQLNAWAQEVKLLSEKNGGFPANH